MKTKTILTTIIIFSFLAILAFAETEDISTVQSEEQLLTMPLPEIREVVEFNSNDISFYDTVVKETPLWTIPEDSNAICVGSTQYSTDTKLVTLKKTNQEEGIVYSIYGVAKREAMQPGSIGNYYKNLVIQYEFTNSSSSRIN